MFEKAPVKKAYLPLILSSLVAIGALTAILLINAPNSAADWGSILSAIVSIVALGALLTTLGLQREELSLQRVEISRMATASQEQSLHARRQSLVESYRGIDEKIDILFNSPDFKNAIGGAYRISDLQEYSDELENFGGEIASVDLQNVRQLSTYKFITSHHLLPITFQESDGYGGGGNVHRALISILHFMILGEVNQAAAMIKHIYSLAKELDLLDYARATINRKSELEPILYILSEYKPINTGTPFEHCRLSPNEQEEEFREVIDFHMRTEQKFYNYVTAQRAGFQTANGPPWSEMKKADHFRHAPETSSGRAV